MDEHLLEEFGRISLSTQEVAAIGRINMAFLCTTLYVANEVFVLQKLLASQFNRSKLTDPDLNALPFINRFVIVRNLSARVFEFMKLFEDQRKKWARASSSDELDRTNQLAERLAVLKQGDHYAFSADLRNKITNHYIVSDVGTYLDATEDGADLTIYLHAEHGNSFFPLGEEVVFIGFINHFLNERGYAAEQRSVFLDEWTGWLLKAVKWTNDVVEEFSLFIYVIKLGHKSIEMKNCRLPADFVADIHTFASPLILRDRKKGSR